MRLNHIQHMVVYLWAAKCGLPDFAVTEHSRASFKNAVPMPQQDFVVARFRATNPSNAYNEL